MPADTRAVAGKGDMGDGNEIGCGLLVVGCGLAEEDTEGGTGGDGITDSSGLMSLMRSPKETSFVCGWSLVVG